MRLLLSLGYETPAPKFLPEHEKIIDKNPEGFYELYHEIIGGVHTDVYKGMVVKLFPPTLFISDLSLIDKLIICHRDYDGFIKSYTPIHKILNEPYDPKTIYEWNYGVISQLKRMFDCCEINFEEHKNPNKLKRKLKKYLSS